MVTYLLDLPQPNDTAALQEAANLDTLARAGQRVPCLSDMAAVTIASWWTELEPLTRGEFDPEAIDTAIGALLEAGPDTPQPKADARDLRRLARWVRVKAAWNTPEG